MGPLGAKAGHVAVGAAKAGGCLAKLGPFGTVLGGILHFAEWLEVFIFKSFFGCIGVLVLIIGVLSIVIFILAHR